MRRSVASGLFLSLFAVNSTVAPADPAETPAAKNRYIGAKACKNCHSGVTKGDQFQKWESTRHAKAFETLATPEARKVADERKIADPQKSVECMKCHATAYIEEPANLKKGFQMDVGVQCESCHGPGEVHAKARLAAAAETEGTVYAKIPADEIVANPSAKTCLKCHNDESPTFQPFCFKKRDSVILHLDPRKGRTAEEIKAITECGCGDACQCKQAECSEH